MNTFCLLAANASAGIIAGLFFTWSNAVMPGLRKVDDHSFLHAMQACNKAIQNPPFFIAFLLPLILLPVLIGQEARTGNSRCFYLLLAAALLYICVWAITLIVHVPLNDQLSRIPLSQVDEKMQTTARIAFEKKWVFFNHIRTAAAITSFFLLLIATVVFHRP